MKAARPATESFAISAAVAGLIYFVAFGVNCGMLWMLPWYAQLVFLAIYVSTMSLVMALWNWYPSRLLAAIVVILGFVIASIPFPPLAQFHPWSVLFVFVPVWLVARATHLRRKSFDQTILI